MKIDSITASTRLAHAVEPIITAAYIASQRPVAVTKIDTPAINDIKEPTSIATIDSLRSSSDKVHIKPEIDKIKEQIEENQLLQELNKGKGKVIDIEA